MTEILECSLDRVRLDTEFRRESCGWHAERYLLTRSAGCVGTSEVDAGLVLVTVHTPAIPGLHSPTEIQARGVLPGRRQKQPAASERGGLLNS